MRLFNKISLVSLLALIGVGAGVQAWAQTGSASVYGEVVDAQRKVVSSATVTVTNVRTGLSQNTLTDQRGAYRFVALQPGTYDIKVELTGFKTSLAKNIVLLVDTATKLTLTLEVGGFAEIVDVRAETKQINTTDASLGNALSREQIRNLPVEAENIVHLLSLQPGSVFIPKMPQQAGGTGTGGDEEDPRYGAVSGARTDQQNVTLDGVDDNDVQNQTAYTSAVRITHEALQEFRVSTSTYNAEMGRSSGPQVSLITRSGGAHFDGSGYWTFRR